MGPIASRRFRIYVGYPDSVLKGDPLVLIRATNTLLNIAGIDNFTRYIDRGFWMRKGETAVIFEIISSSMDMPRRVKHAAVMLKEMPEGKQEAVLVTTEPTEAYVI